MIFGEVIAYLSVFVASAMNLNYGVGLSMTYDMTAFELFLLLSTGSVTGIATTLYFGSRLRDYWYKKYTPAGKHDKKPSLTMRVWRRYGLVGLAFISFLVGPIPIVAVALLSGIKKELILLYLGGGKFFWAFLLAFLGHQPIQHILHSIFQ